MKLSRIPSVLILILEKVISGLKEMFPDPQAKIDFDGVEMLVIDLIARFAAYLGAFKAVEAAEKARKTAMGKRRPIESVVEHDLVLLREALIPKLGRTSQTLSDFGFDPAKERRQLTSVEKVAKSEKAMQTRQENHTMGKRQKRLARKNAANGNGDAANGNPPKPQ